MKCTWSLIIQLLFNWTCYLIEHRNQIPVRVFELLSLVKNIAKNITKDLGGK